MKIRLASNLQYDSIVDGEGIRTVIWTQGCPHNCKGCHNPETHDCNAGILTDTEEIKKAILLYPNQDGITLSGGDPLFQPEASYDIASFAKKNNLNVWCYTGYTFEALLEKAKKDEIYMKLLKEIDVLIDGRFILEKRSLSLKYRGSSNQRIIDVQKSISENRIVTIDKYDIQNIGNDLYQKPEYMFV
jgi:anaerobic ribonucleoside-triphosphate reductase activating protein